MPKALQVENRNEEPKQQMSKAPWVTRYNALSARELRAAACQATAVITWRE